MDERAASAWLLTLWREAAPVAALGAQLLSPKPVLPGQPVAAPRSPQVCNCLDVSEARICAQLQSLSGTTQDRLHGLQASLRCGTQCGSCLPSLRRLEAQTPFLEEVLTS